MKPSLYLYWFFLRTPLFRLSEILKVILKLLLGIWRIICTLEFVDHYKPPLTKSDWGQKNNVIEIRYSQNENVIETRYFTFNMTFNQRTEYVTTIDWNIFCLNILQPKISALNAKKTTRSWRLLTYARIALHVHVTATCTQQCVSNYNFHYYKYTPNLWSNKQTNSDYVFIAVI